MRASLLRWQQSGGLRARKVLGGSEEAKEGRKGHGLLLGPVLFNCRGVVSQALVALSSSTRLQSSHKM